MGTYEENLPQLIKLFEKFYEAMLPFMANSSSDILGNVLHELKRLHDLDTKADKEKEALVTHCYKKNCPQHVWVSDTCKIIQRCKKFDNPEYPTPYPPCLQSTLKIVRRKLNV